MAGSVASATLEAGVKPVGNVTKWCKVLFPGLERQGLNSTTPASSKAVLTVDLHMLFKDVEKGLNEVQMSRDHAFCSR
jgi:hypothetical protein